MIPNFSIAGFRSFGSEHQFFESLGKINLIIGPNNSGKSNVLRFIEKALNAAVNPAFEQLDFHIGEYNQILLGHGEYDVQLQLEFNEHSPFYNVVKDRPDLVRFLRSIYSKIADKYKSNVAWTMEYLTPAGSVANIDVWEEILQSYSDDMIFQFWNKVTSSSHGNKSDWITEILRLLQNRSPKYSVYTIPAIREINSQYGDMGDAPLDGKGIIHKLARFQNPTALEQDKKKKIYSIRDFLRFVTDSQDAEIEIPYDRSTIIVHMNNRSLPIESLGSGIHEVIIIAAAATVISDSVLCIEEPELHLNPILQRKLMRYLSENTSNQYFISTHSPVLMDTPNVEIYRIALENGVSKVTHVTGERDKVLICEELGYHPSDLIQTNCIVWVEGPSDRIYLNYWLKQVDSSLIEGIHYSIMFYGGRLAAHISNADFEQVKGGLIALRKLNQRSVILIDSDKKSAHARVNETKKRLEIEFNRGPGFGWITAGREVENYLDKQTLKDAVLKVHPQAKLPDSWDKYDSLLSLTNRSGSEIKAKKVEIAHEYVNLVSHKFNFIYDS